MPQAAYQLDTGPKPWAVQVVSGTVCTVQAADPDGIVVRWSGGATSTIAPGTQAATVAGAVAVDSGADLYLVVATTGANTLALVKLADALNQGMDTILSGATWGIVAELTHNRMREHQQCADSGSIGGASGLETCTAYFGDGTGTALLTLWNGTANVAPPAGWQTSGFDDSTWTAPVAAGPAHGVWTSASPASATQAILLREHIGTPSAIAVSVTIALTVDGNLVAAYWNGTPLPLSGTGGTATVATATLNQTGPNILAVEAQATASHASVVAEVTICTIPDLSKPSPINWYRDDALVGTRRGGSMNEGTDIAIVAADDPAGDKVDFTFSIAPAFEARMAALEAIFAGAQLGDILYYNGTAWAKRHIGTPGDFLRVDTTLVPVWQHTTTLSGPQVFTTGTNFWKARTLYNGGAYPNDNNPPPAGWQTPGFDDSAWTAPAQANVGAGAPTPPGATLIWAQLEVFSGNEQTLYRRSFQLPGGTLTSAVLAWTANDFCMETWINGVQVQSSAGQAVSPTTGMLTDATAVYQTSIATSLLLPGQINVIAIRAANNNGHGGVPDNSNAPGPGYPSPIGGGAWLGATLTIQ